MQDRTRLREALAAALAEAQEAHAPDRVLALLRGAYRSLDSAQFVDDDMIRWAEAGLGAWRRWSAQLAPTQHHLLVVDGSNSIADDLRALAPGIQIARVEVVTSRAGTLEALATQPPTAVLFDLDAHELAPTKEMLEWLATEFPQIRRLGCAEATGPYMLLQQRGLYHAVLPKPPTSEQLATVLAAAANPSSRHP
jgi:hypothetical protein